jgi:hypothetical protein
MLRPKFFAAVIAAATIATSSSAFAGQNNTTFTVSAQIQNYCGITVQNINFGNYTGAAITTGNSQLQVTCNFSDGINPWVTMTSANNWNMHDPNGGSTHPYLPYTLQYYTTVWNGYTTGTQIGLSGWTNNVANVQLRGVLAANLPATTGDTYTDTVTAYINY